MEEPNDTLGQMIRRAATGDRSALESVLLHFHDPLLRFIQSALCRGDASAVASEDVLQETLIEAFRRIETLEPRGGDAFFAWLKTIATTRHANLVRARQALKRGGKLPAAMPRGNAASTATSILGLLAGPDRTPSRIVRRDEAVGLVARALGALGPDRRQAIELRYGRGMSLQEVAEQTGKSVGAVKMLLHRALAQLRETLGEEFGEFSAGA